MEQQLIHYFPPAHIEDRGPLADWPGDVAEPMEFWVHCLIGGTDAFAFVTLDPAVLPDADFRTALTSATADALGLPVSVVTVKACRVAAEPPF